MNGNNQGMPEVPPEMRQKLEAYQGIMSKMIYSKDTRTSVYDMLASAPPEASVPQTALTVTGQVEGALEQRGEIPGLDVRLAGGVFLINELVTVGNEGGLWQMSQEDGLSKFLEPAMTQYIQQGIKKGTIDPVELQEKVEPLMNEEESSMGMRMGEGMGVPAKAGQQAAMDTYANKKLAVAKQKQTLQKGGV